MDLDKNRVESFSKICRLADIYLRTGQYHEAQELFEQLGEKMKQELRYESEHQPKEAQQSKA